MKEHEDTRVDEGQPQACRPAGSTAPADRCDSTAESPWMGEARQMAAQCWCDAETSHIEMDAALCEAVARRIAAWVDTSVEYARNQEFYMGLLDRIAGFIGPEAFTCDDGSHSDSPLRAKLPELVAALVEVRQSAAAVDPHVGGSNG